MRDAFFDDFEIAMKVVIVGNGSVGKSSMIQRFCRGIFTRDYKKTIGVDFLERVMTIDDQNVRLMLWDTAGQEEFDAITRTYYRGANACVLACSVTDKDSFLALPKWKNKVCRECGDIPMVLMCNKIDLQKQALFDNSELESMARSLGIPKLFRTSVKDDVNVNAVFKYLAEMYVHASLSPTPPPDDDLLLGGGHGHSPTNQKDDLALVPSSQPHQSKAKSFLFGFNKPSSTPSNSNMNIKVNKMNKANVMKQQQHLTTTTKNPVILKSATPAQNPNQTKSFFHKKQSTNGITNGINNGSSANGHVHGPGHGQYIFHGGKGGAFMLDHPHSGGYYRSQSYHRPYHYVDPSRWTDPNLPFRLDYVGMGHKKRRKDICTIL